MKAAIPPGLRQDSITIRPFNGSRADAEGILRIERATFNESPYAVESVQSMLTEGPQHAWVATHGDVVVGFVIAFLTAGLSGLWWEIDLLAVHPEWRGYRLSSRLIRVAVAHGQALAGRARAVTATDNDASLRAFLRTGFRIKPGRYQLLIDRPQDRPARHGAVAGVLVCEACSRGEIGHWLDSLSRETRSPMPEPAMGQPASGLVRSGCVAALLLAEQGGRPAGYAELIEVQTLLYRGVWIESMLAPTCRVREALIGEAVNRAQEAGMDEIGALVPEGDRPLARTLLAMGFRSLGAFHWLEASLPLPDRVAAPVVLSVR